MSPFGPPAYIGVRELCTFVPLYSGMFSYSSCRSVILWRWAPSFCVFTQDVPHEVFVPEQLFDIELAQRTAGGILTKGGIVPVFEGSCPQGEVHPDLDAFRFLAGQQQMARGRGGPEHRGQGSGGGRRAQSPRRVVPSDLFRRSE